MIGNVKKLSNEAPIILTWVPRVHGASLPDGKNSRLNYLDIIKNHKLKNEEERDIYLIINGPGFKQSQIDNLKRELKGIEGVHVIDLHQYDWSEIDQGWKIDGKDTSIKDFFRDMYNMTGEQRTYFAVEIDTFRLVALALLKQFTEHEGGIYIDFDSLKAIDTHIGKDITIPEGILLGPIVVGINDSGKIVYTQLNNDLIAINDLSIAVDILSKYKSEILSQKEMCGKLVEYLPSAIIKLGDCISMLEKEEEMKKEEEKDEIKRIIKEVKNQKEYAERCVEDLSNGRIATLYEQAFFPFLTQFGENLGQRNVVRIVHDKLIGQEESKWKSFAFGENNGNYSMGLVNSDVSWMKGKDLYRERVDNKLEGAEVDRVAMGELSLI
ncbi:MULTISPECIES: hypothetical protein [Wolbachia]|uniref:hypothetical protein n=1 Tax=Wolbachia TaxID=953 RepID=UPI001E5908AB|nr:MULTISPECIES: hypothetical protein [unclassified Wolbachia]UFO00580.1 hypothetical protein LOK48_01135 [Wolbachia endosymbiont of Corcyra cephalonica]